MSDFAPIFRRICSARRYAGQTLGRSRSGCSGNSRAWHGISGDRKHRPRSRVGDRFRDRRLYYSPSAICRAWGCGCGLCGGVFWHILAEGVRTGAVRNPFRRRNGSSSSSGSRLRLDRYSRQMPAARVRWTYTLTLPAASSLQLKLADATKIG